MDRDIQEEFHNVYSTINGKIDRVHEKLDDHNETMTKLRVAIQKLNTTLEKTPSYPERPCPELKKHLEEMTWWKRSVLANIIRHVITGIMSALAAVFTFKFWEKL